MYPSYRQTVSETMVDAGMFEPPTAVGVGTSPADSCLLWLHRQTSCYWHFSDTAFFKKKKKLFRRIRKKQIEGSKQPCTKRVCWCLFFSYSICSLCVSVSLFDNSCHISNSVPAERLSLTEGSDDGLNF